MNNSGSNLLSLKIVFMYFKSQPRFHASRWTSHFKSTLVTIGASYKIADIFLLFFWVPLTHLDRWLAFFTKISANFISWHMFPDYFLVNGLPCRVLTVKPPKSSIKAWRFAFHMINIITCHGRNYIHFDLKELIHLFTLIPVSISCYLFVYLSRLITSQCNSIASIQSNRFILSY